MIVSDVEQGSVDWYNLRHGKVTGSRLGRVFGARTAPKTFLRELVAERMTEPDIDNFNSKAMEWGNTWESFAVKEASKNREIDFEVCGMMICEEIENFAVSPDAVYYGDSNNIIGGIEVKSPDSKTHVEYLLDGVLPKKYEWQVYAPFLCSKDVQWWDFASYDPRNYSRQLFMVRVERAEIADKIENAKETLINFLNEVKKAHTSLIF